MEMTPRCFSSSVSVASLFSTPRGLNEPVRWSSSALKRMSAPTWSESVAELSSGVRCRRPPMRSRARSTSLSEISAPVVAIREIVRTCPGTVPGRGCSCEGVLRPRAALRRGEPAALRRDRAALDAIRRRDVDAVRRRLVHLRGAHPLPHPRELGRDVAPDDDVVRLVVPRLVPGCEDRRELVERELSVGRRVALRAVGAEQLLLAVALRARVARREVALRRGHSAGQRAAEPEAAPERLAHVAHLFQVLPHEALTQRLVIDREGAGRRRGLPA